MDLLPDPKYLQRGGPMFIYGKLSRLVKSQLPKNDISNVEAHCRWYSTISCSGPVNFQTLNTKFELYFSGSLDTNHDGS